MVELQKQEPLYGVCRYPIKSIVVLLKIFAAVAAQKVDTGR